MQHMFNDFSRDATGATWTHQRGDRYVVTGVDARGRRFRIVTDSWMHAAGINLYQGSKWLERYGKRKLLQRVYN